MTEQGNQQVARTGPPFSMTRVLWTAALAGGVLSGFLILAPGSRKLPWLDVAVGVLVAVYVLRTLLRKFGRAAHFGQALYVGGASALVPGLVSWVTLKWTYPQFVATVQRAAEEAKASPHVSTDQADAYLRMVTSPAGPWIVGVSTLLSMVLFAALIGFAADIVLLWMAPKGPEKAPPVETGG